jgi:hypothetical protein
MIGFLCVLCHLCTIFRNLVGMIDFKCVLRHLCTIFINMIGYIPSWSVIRKSKPITLFTLKTRQEIREVTVTVPLVHVCFKECARIESQTFKGSSLSMSL